MRRIIITVVVTLVLSISFVHVVDGWATDRPATFTVSETDAVGSRFVMYGTLHEDGKPDKTENYYIDIDEYFRVDPQVTYEIELHHDWGGTTDYVGSIGDAVPD